MYFISTGNYVKKYIIKNVNRFWNNGCSIKESPCTILLKRVYI